MTSKKISDLDEATTVDPTDLFVIVQGGDTKKVSADKVGSSKSILTDLDEPYYYVGTAPVGSNPSDLVWDVTRIELVIPITSGEASSSAWDDRTTLTYS
jgi:hypothetical protein